MDLIPGRLAFSSAALSEAKFKGFFHGQRKADRRHSAQCPQIHWPEIGRRYEVNLIDKAIEKNPARVNKMDRFQENFERLQSRGQGVGGGAGDKQKKNNAGKISIIFPSIFRGAITKN